MCAIVTVCKKIMPYTKLSLYYLNYMQVFIVTEYADDYFQTLHEQGL